MLASAVEMPRFTFFGEMGHKTIYDQAAAYLYHIVVNHTFNDENKRICALTAILLLEENGIRCDFLSKQPGLPSQKIGKNARYEPTILSFFSTVFLSGPMIKAMSR